MSFSPKHGRVEHCPRDEVMDIALHAWWQHADEFEGNVVEELNHRVFNATPF